MTEKDVSVIPYGPYCYTIEDVVTKPDMSIKIKSCPYWELREDKPHQKNGYCQYLEAGDWEEDGTSFLFDQVKECGIRCG